MFCEDREIIGEWQVYLVFIRVQHFTLLPFLLLKTLEFLECFPKDSFLRSFHVVLESKCKENAYGGGALSNPCYDSSQPRAIPCTAPVSWQISIKRETIYLGWVRLHMLGCFKTLSVLSWFKVQNFRENWKERKCCSASTCETSLCSEL